MKHPDVFKGMKIIRSAVILKLISNALILLSALITFLHGELFKQGSEAGSKLTLFLLIAMPLGLILAVISVFRLLRGCKIAGSEDDNFNNARFILFIALLVDIGAAALSFISIPNSVLFGRLAVTASAVCEAISVFFIVRSANRILAQNGETQISSNTVRTIASVTSLLVLGALLQTVSALLGNTGSFMMLLSLIGTVFGLISTVIYCIYLIRAVKALASVNNPA